MKIADLEDSENLVAILSIVDFDCDRSLFSNKFKDFVCSQKNFVDRFKKLVKSSEIVCSTPIQHFSSNQTLSSGTSDEEDHEINPASTTCKRKKKHLLTAVKRACSSKKSISTNNEGGIDKFWKELVDKDKLKEGKKEKKKWF